MKRLPIRSALYVPGDHARAMAKAPGLPADMLIYDLEDGVSPAHKALARTAINKTFLQGNSAHLRLIRVNHTSSPFYSEDLRMAAETACDGVMLSKVASVNDVNNASQMLATQQRADLAIWCNIETPSGILHAAEIAAHPAVKGLVAGTNDLANDLRIGHRKDRAGLLFSLQQIVLAARAYGCYALDGTYVDFADSDALQTEAEQGRMLGFDGKTLVHPDQIDVVNEVFSPSEDDIKAAHELIIAYEKAMAEGNAVMVHAGHMIEALHYRRALELIASQN